MSGIIEFLLTSLVTKSKTINDYTIPDNIFVENGKKYDTTKSRLIAFHKGICDYISNDGDDTKAFEAAFLYISKNGTFFKYTLFDGGLSGRLIGGHRILDIDEAYKLYEKLENKIIPYEEVFGNLIKEG